MILYREYDLDAVRARAGRARTAWRGQLLVGERIVWAPGLDEAALPTPSEVVWKAAQEYRESHGRFPFLPRELDERVDEGLELFVRKGGDRFLYLGRAELASWGISHDEPLGNVRAILDTKLPKELWTELGGYEGWAVGEATGLSGEEAVASVRRILSTGQGDASVTRYEEDVLVILAARERAFVMYLAEPGDDGAVAVDAALEDDARIVEVTLDNGQVDEWPIGETLSHGEAVAAAHHFVATGELAPFVTWRR